MKWSACAALCLLASTVHADGLGPAMPLRPAATTPFAPEVFRARRAKVLAQMKDGVGILLGEPHHDDEEMPENLDFFYLTGLWDEPDDALLLAPKSLPAERETLYLPYSRPEIDRATGYRVVLPNRAAELRTGFDRLRPFARLGALFSGLAERDKKLQYFGWAVGYEVELPKVLDLYQKTVQRVPGAHIEDAHLIIGRLRMVKEPRELEKIQRATDITLAGHLEAMRHVRPGMRERELKQLLEDSFRKGGAHQLSYGSIVGGGPDSCVAHYPDDERVIEADELVLIDAAAAFDHYASDITRTFPASGHFSAEQRKVYEVVLAAQNAALAKVRPGVTWGELNRAAAKVIDDAGYHDYAYHGVGHHVGLQVHDLGNWALQEPIAEGSVITVEPGIYIPEKKLGVRIEDMVLVTHNGAKILSAALPRDPDAIEHLLASGRR